MNNKAFTTLTSHAITGGALPRSHFEEESRKKVIAQVLSDPLFLEKEERRLDGERMLLEYEGKDEAMSKALLHMERANYLRDREGVYKELNSKKEILKEKLVHMQHVKEHLWEYYDQEIVPYKAFPEQEHSERIDTIISYYLTLEKALVHDFLGLAQKLEESWSQVNIGTKSDIIYLKTLVAHNKISDEIRRVIVTYDLVVSSLRQYFLDIAKQQF